MRGVDTGGEGEAGDSFAAGDERTVESTSGISDIFAQR